MDPDTTILGRHREDFERINREIRALLNSRIPLIEHMGAHILLGDGKRIRPLFFMLCSQLCNYRGKDIYRLSTVFEYIHAASLLHDDVLDSAEVRRNKPSANHLWGNHAAVLEGDFLFSRAVSVALDTHNLVFLKKLSEATTQMTEGQILELVHTGDWHLSKERYMEIITAKTAVLMSAACACGAIVAGAEDEIEQSLAEFGLKVGIAFQLMDDVLDYTSSQEMIGKPVGKDLKEGKITLPLLATLSKLDRRQREQIETLFSTKKATEEDHKNLIDLVRRQGALETVRSEAQFYVDEAAACLSPFPLSPAKEDVLELSQYVVERAH